MEGWLWWAYRERITQDPWVRPVIARAGNSLDRIRDYWLCCWRWLRSEPVVVQLGFLMFVLQGLAVIGLGQYIHPADLPDAASLPTLGFLMVFMGYVFYRRATRPAQAQ